MKIHSLAYIGVYAKDPRSWLHFGTQVLGMMDVSDKLAGGSDDVFLKMDERDYRLVVESSDMDSYGFSGWQVTGPDDIEEARATLKTFEIDYQDASDELIAKRRVQDLISFSDPDGNRHELSWGNISDFRRFVSPVGVSSFVTGDLGFGHVVLPAPNFDKTIAFYQDVMGFDLSDLMKLRFTPDPAEPEKRLHFMHCNERHHSLALFEAPFPAGCVHIMVEVPNVDEVGHAMDRMIEHEVKLTGTLGRHANDKMVSFYMQSPGGFMVEYGAEGLSVQDWSRYASFQSTAASIWGHDFSVGQD